MGQFKGLGCAQLSRQGQGQAQREHAFPVVTPAGGQDQSPGAAAHLRQAPQIPRALVSWVCLPNSFSLREWNWLSRSLNPNRYGPGPSL